MESILAVVRPYISAGLVHVGGITELEGDRQQTTSAPVATWSDHSYRLRCRIEPSNGRVRFSRRWSSAANTAAQEVADLLLAATGEFEGLTVLHYDTDLDVIAEVTGQPTEWVVPRGTVP